MADGTPRVGDEVVNVTDAFPDPDNQVVGAAVLIDPRIGENASRTDFRRRPVFVVYTSKSAARRAVASRPSAGYLRFGERVIYLPAGFPDRARGAYERGLVAGLE